MVILQFAFTIVVLRKYRLRLENLTALLEAFATDVDIAQIWHFVKVESLHVG